MKKLLLISAIFLILQGCNRTTMGTNQYKTKPEINHNLEQEKRHAANKAKDNYLYYYIAHSFSQADIEAEAIGANRDKNGVKTESNGYGYLYTFNGEKSLMLSEVVSKMSEQLLYNFPKRYHNETIALTSIVDLNDHTLTNWLGQTISEQLIHELHIRNLRIIDFKLTGNIQLTEDGEFALTRDWKKLNKNLDVQRILTGTMSRNEEGMIVNVRIVNTDSNLVESTSSAFIPHSMFVGGEYDYQSKKYYSRNSRVAKDKKQQVQLVR